MMRYTTGKVTFHSYCRLSVREVDVNAAVHAMGSLYDKITSELLLKDGCWRVWAPFGGVRVLYVALNGKAADTSTTCPLVPKNSVLAKGLSRVEKCCRYML